MPGTLVTLGTEHAWNAFRWGLDMPGTIENFNSPGEIVHSVDIFPFWAKIKTVNTASCDDFCKNFLSRNQDHAV